MRKYLHLLLCAVVAGAAAAQVDTKPSELEVQRASDAFAAARRSGDAAAFAALFTDDGIFMVPGLPDASGRAAIQALAERRFKGGSTEDIKIHRREIHITGDSAYELTWYSEVDRRQEQAFRMDGRQLILWKRGSDNVWRVQRYLYNFSAAEPIT